MNNYNFDQEVVESPTTVLLKESKQTMYIGAGDPLSPKLHFNRASDGGHETLP